jgi:CHASE2 domain-containing sensor protein
MKDRGKLVVLKLEGDLPRQGFRVTVEIGLEGNRPYAETTGWLPPAPELVAHLERWQKQYRSLGMQTRIKPKEIIYQGSIDRFESCRQVAKQLGDRLNLWLESESFRPLDKRLREEMSRHEPIRVLIRTQDRYLHKLPWYLWDFIEHYPQAEVAFGTPAFDRVETLPRATEGEKVRILAILGHGQGIDVEADRQVLEALPDADVTFLVEPQRQQLCDRLWERSWDILFFAGHSETEGERGRIYLNPQESLTVEELKYALKRAIAKGLKIAIFNSCDGLGLAQQLEQLGLPQIIVMREPVPDQIAQEFLKYFLGAFARGDSLYASERQARERLQGWEHRFPCASLLPTLYQNPAASPPDWQALQGDREIGRLGDGGTRRKFPSHPSPIQNPPFSPFLPTEGRKYFGERAAASPKSKTAAQDIVRATQNWLSWRELKIALGIALLCTCLLIGARSLGMLQAWELQAFDRLVQLRPAQESDRRILVVTIDEADIQYQIKQGMKLQGSLSDEAFAQLLRKLTPYKPRAIGSDIVHDFPYGSELAALLKQNPQFVAICRVNNPESNLVSIAPPPGIPVKQLGFTNFALDPDNVIRRQILGMATDDICQSDRAFSLQLALRYLGNPPVKLTADGLWIDKVFIKQLEHDAGGYQLLPKEALGFQILMNYRSSSPEQVPLREILNGTTNERLAELVKDRIVLIGVRGEKRDLHFTPYSIDRRQTPGVIVQAQMVSQILSVVLDGRLLMWWLPQWGEILWIGSWSLVGGVLVLPWRSLIYRGVALGIALGILAGSCYLLLLECGWIPLVPSALGLIITGASVTVYQLFQTRKI